MRALRLRKRERIALVRRALNEESIGLNLADPEQKLRWFVMRLIGILDGDEEQLTPEETKRVERMRAEWLALRPYR